MARPFLSVVIPAFNEEGRILPTLERVVRYLCGQAYLWEVIVVDDGSSDRTAELVGQFAESHRGVRVERTPHGGKGWAVRHGMLTACGEARFMCDADLATPIEYLEDFLERMAQGFDIIIGSRQIKGARRFNEPFIRHALGRLFNWTVRLVAVYRFQDTQCGFKLFRGEAAKDVFELQRTKGFGFDVEVLYIALKKGMRVLEMPIAWHHQEASKVRAGVDSLAMLRDTMLVRWHDLQGKYDRKASSPKC